MFCFDSILRPTTEEYIYVFVVVIYIYISLRFVSFRLVWFSFFLIFSRNEHFLVIPIETHIDYIMKNKLYFKDNIFDICL